MEIWLNDKLGGGVATEHITDSLNLRWNSRNAISDANLITGIFHPPNCIDPTPDGMGIWKNAQIKDTIIRVMVTDDKNVTTTITWKSDKNLNSADRNILGWNYIKESENTHVVRGSGFRDALGLFLVIIELVDGTNGLFKLISLYTQIKQLSKDSLEKLLKISPNSTVNTNTSSNESTREAENIPQIGGANNTTKITTITTILPPSVFNNTISGPPAMTVGGAFTSVMATNTNNNVNNTGIISTNSSFVPSSMIPPTVTLPMIGPSSIGSSTMVPPPTTVSISKSLQSDQLPTLIGSYPLSGGIMGAYPLAGLQPHSNISIRTPEGGAQVMGY